MVPYGGDLANEREEAFARLTCDGMPLAEAFRLAGLKAGSRSDPLRLWRQDRIQERVKALLKARAETGAVTLPQVTDMLQRVFAGALHAQDYSPAHNAAFSLARLYGLVIDRAQVDVMRRPSRDPDAPAEQALASWVQSLPALPAPAPSGGLGPVLDAPAAPYGASPAEPGTVRNPSPAEPDQAAGARAPGPGPVIEGLAWRNAGANAQEREFSNDFNDLAGPEPGGEFENGAPSGPVTGTPSRGAFSGYMDRFATGVDLDASDPGTPPGPKRKRVPPRKKRVPASRGKKAKKPSRVPNRVPTFKDLFG